MRRFKWAALAMMFWGMAGGAWAQGDSNDPARREQFPHFASLKFDAVRARMGAGDDFPPAWFYQRKDMPVYVLEPSGDWRLIRDAWGDQAWVRARSLGLQRTGLILRKADGMAILRKGPSAKARAIAKIAPGAAVRIDRCEGQYCEIALANHKGWALRSEIWGDAPDDALPRLAEQAWAQGGVYWASLAPAAE